MNQQHKNAYQTAWDAYYVAIKRFCLSRLRYNRVIAEDCCQETFKAYWEALQKGQKIQHVQAWLYKVADNVVKKAQKQMYIQQEEMPLTDTDKAEPAVGIDFLEEILTQHFSDEELLELVKETLTEQERFIFNGCFVKGEEAACLAEQLGISVNHFYKKKSLLKQKLKTRIRSVLESALNKALE